MLVNVRFIGLDQVME